MANADGNVLFAPGKTRALLVNLEPTWHIQKFGDGVNPTGVAPSAGGNPVLPTIGAQKALWSGCELGGLFDFGGPQVPVVLESVYTSHGSMTVNIVGVTGVVRLAPAMPFKLTAGEKLKVVLTGVIAGQFAEIGVLARKDPGQSL